MTPPAQEAAKALQDRFHELLVGGAAELYQDHRDHMDRPELLPTPNVIDDADLALLFEGLDSGLITLERGARFNTLDRPMPGGRWSLLSRSRAGGWYNAEYLPQLAAYVELIRRLGYPAGRVLFELPPRSLQLDLAVLTDTGGVAVLGEAKRAAAMLDTLVTTVAQRWSQAPPAEDTKRRGDEARQLAWRLWLTRSPYLWLVGPGVRRAYRCTYGPLILHTMPSLPAASLLGLAERPATALVPPVLA